MSPSVMAEREREPAPEPEPQVVEPAPVAAVPVFRPSARKGKRLVEIRGCVDCHSDQPDEYWGGPTFAGYWGSAITNTDGSVVVVDEGHVIESILDPLKLVAEGESDSMPSYQDRFSDEELAHIVAYLRGLVETEAE